MPPRRALGPLLLPLLLLLLPGRAPRADGEAAPTDAEALREAIGDLGARDDATRRGALVRLEVLSRGRPACLDRAVPRLRRLLRHGARDEAAHAVRLLARCPDGQEDWLDALDAEGEPEVYLAAVDAAGEAPPGATRALVEIARDAEAPAPRRALALEALGTRPGPAALLLLTRPLARPEPWLLAAGRAMGLARRGGKAACAGLCALLRSDEAAPRVHAWEGLVGLTGARLPLDPAAWDAYVAAHPGAGDHPPVEAPPDGDGAHRYAAPTPLHVPTYYGVPIDRARSHVVFCLDTSQSMYGRGIDQARAELRRTLLDFPATYAFDVIAFHRAVTPLFGRLVVAHPVVKAVALARIDAFETISYTNIYDAVETAFGYAGIGRLAREPTARLDAIFLLSDGAPNRGRYWRPDDVVREIGELSRGRIPVHCVAAGEEVFPLLGRIAEATGGRFVDAFEFE